MLPYYIREAPGRLAEPVQVTILALIKIFEQYQARDFQGDLVKFLDKVVKIYINLLLN
jgi:hypothetical protein